MKKDNVWESSLFIATPLNPYSEQDLADIESFIIDNPNGQGLANYLKLYACKDELSNQMRTYIVRLKDTKECVGYFSLKAGLISCNEVEIEQEDDATGATKIIEEFDTLPGIELANFAVNSFFVNKYEELKGVGFTIFSELILPIVYSVSEYVGVNMIYIFALDYETLINRYKRYGFSRLDSESENKLHQRVKPSYDDDCIFMYQLL